MRLIFQKVSLSTFLTPVFVFLVQTQYFEGVFGKNHLNHVKYIVPQKNTFFCQKCIDHIGLEKYELFNSSE